MKTPNRKPNVTCDLCATPMYRRPNLLDKNAGKYCSRACRNRAHPHTSKRATSPAMLGANNHAWKGGVTQFKRKGNYKGIPYIRASEKLRPMARADGYIMEHRAVMAEWCGYLLTRTEVVHHVDHDPTNNPRCNLELWPTNRSHKLWEHGRFVPDAVCRWFPSPGWGTALKPAHEPICVARKPLIGTVAANVLAHGTGALNIDGCRVPGAKPDTTRGASSKASSMVGTLGAQGRIVDDGMGRWPANLIHDGSNEVLAAFPQAVGQQGALTGDEPSARAGAVDQNCYGTMDRRHASEPRREDDKSGARFFYCAKASKKDRGEGNTHPTVKPTDLMRYLLRLVTPPGGLALDPFAGSGSTFKAAHLEGFDFIGFELQAEYVAIANAR